MTRKGGVTKHSLDAQQVAFCPHENGAFHDGRSQGGPHLAGCLSNTNVCTNPVVCCRKWMKHRMLHSQYVCVNLCYGGSRRHDDWQGVPDRNLA